MAVHQPAWKRPHPREQIPGEVKRREDVELADPAEGHEANGTHGHQAAKEDAERRQGRGVRAADQQPPEARHQSPSVDLNVNVTPRVLATSTFRSISRRWHSSLACLRAGSRGPIARSMGPPRACTAAIVFLNWSSTRAAF